MGFAGDMRWCCAALYCRLLFILSRRFFRSSRLAAGEAERVCACVGEWECALWSCWYSSLDSLSWESLLWSMSVEEATDGLEDSREEMGGRCWGSSSLPTTPCCRLRDERLGEMICLQSEQHLDTSLFFLLEWHIQYTCTVWMHRIQQNCIGQGCMNVFTNSGGVFQALSLSEDLESLVVNSWFQLFIVTAQTGVHAMLRDHCSDTNTHQCYHTLLTSFWPTCTLQRPAVPAEVWIRALPSLSDSMTRRPRST